MDSEFGGKFSLFGNTSFDLEKFTDKELKFNITPFGLRYSVPNSNE
jgi:hypothetical protein